MASGGRPPQRISSQQARDLIEKIADDSDTDSLISFSSDGDSYHESNNDSSDSDASSAPTPAKPTSSTTDGPPTSKVPRLDTSRPTSSGDTYQQMFCTFVAKSTPTVGKGKRKQRQRRGQHVLLLLTRLPLKLQLRSGVPFPFVMTLSSIVKQETISAL